MEIELCEKGTNHDLETIGIVKTDCKTVGEFVTAVQKRWKEARIEVGIADYRSDMNERKIENISYTDGWGGLVFRIRTKNEFIITNKIKNKKTENELRTEKYWTATSTLQ